MSKLTISQALRQIKQLKGRLAEHQARASQSVSYVSGTKQTFDFKVEREARAAAQDRLVTLEAGVARANAVTVIEAEGRSMTIAEAIRRLAEFKADMAWLASLQLREDTVKTVEQEWDQDTGRHIRRVVETAYVSELSVLARVAEIDALRERFERLNDAVETANHATRVEVEA